MHKGWKKGTISRERYMEGRRRVTEFLEEKKDKWKEKEEMELRMLHNEAEVLKYINKKRGNNGPRMMLAKKDGEIISETCWMAEAQRWMKRIEEWIMS